MYLDGMFCMEMVVWLFLLVVFMFMLMFLMLCSVFIRLVYGCLLSFLWLIMLMLVGVLVIFCLKFEVVIIILFRVCGVLLLVVKVGVDSVLSRVMDRVWWDRDVW